MIELLLVAERLLAVGLLDQAGRLFGQVAEADPRNAMAVVGLARVALERGDEAGAIAFLKRALEIDPENAAAGRMVDRIEEVISNRAAGPIGAEPVAEAASDAVSILEPALAPVRRSWLDRLLGLFRRR